MVELWYEDQNNIAKLARALVERQGYSGMDLIYFLEKPWKWTEEWEKLRSGAWDISDRIKKMSEDQRLAICRKNFGEAEELELAMERLRACLEENEDG